MVQWRTSLRRDEAAAGSPDRPQIDGSFRSVECSRGAAVTIARVGGGFPCIPQAGDRQYAAVRHTKASGGRPSGASPLDRAFDLSTGLAPALVAARELVASASLPWHSDATGAMGTSVEVSTGAVWAGAKAPTTMAPGACYGPYGYPRRWACGYPYHGYSSAFRCSMGGRSRPLDVRSVGENKGFGRGSLG
jgi:hypothetical protein